MIKRAWRIVTKSFPLTENKTLVVLTPGFAKDEEDSTCLPMQQSFLLTAKKIFPRLNIIVLAFQYPYHNNAYTWNGITVIPFNGQNKGGLSKFFLLRRIRSFMNSVHKKNNIDGILSFWYTECGFAGKQFADKYRIRHCCWIWGRDAAKENKFPRRLKPNPNELVTLSDFLQDEFERNHKVKPLHVVPPGIHSGLFPAMLPTKDIDILAAGSLIPLKQYDIFIKVIAEIKKQIPGIKVILIGNGPEKENLERLIRSTELESNIIMAGELPYPAVMKHMQRTRVFLHTSSYEGFGAVCLEALHGGAYVISFTKPMNVDIPHWQVADDKEDMVQKALERLEKPVTEYFPVTPFTMEDSVRKMMNLFA
ncbi:MAG TPA: glycosyltransferase, partial [Chitinophagaceae bacterium]|nr:glycosyltransferase [Chitinophagaceae bacterium]